MSDWFELALALIGGGIALSLSSISHSLANIADALEEEEEGGEE